VFRLFWLFVTATGNLRIGILVLLMSLACLEGYEQLSGLQRSWVEAKN
jgi:hypothetical protein